MKKKIILCAIDEITDPKSWSGTHYNLFTQFENTGVLGLTIVYGIRKSKFLTIFLNWYEKHFFLRRDARDFFVSTLYERKLSELINDKCMPADPVFFQISEYCVPKKILSKGIFASYMDATLKGLLSYAPMPKQPFPFYMAYIHRKSNQYLSRLSYMFTQNEWTRQSLINDYNCPQNKVFNVGFGINVKPYHGEKDYTNKKMLIILRRGSENLKGLTLLYEAFKHIKAKHTLAELHVVGTTYLPYRGISYYENFPREKTEELFKECTLYVMPALCEVNGITYLEALASKIPIVGLNRFAFPEFCNYGEYGFIVNHPDPEELADKVNLALENPALLQSMGIRGQENSLKKYTWENTVVKITTILDNV